MAIAYDTKNVATTGGGASSLTYAHTCTGSDLILFVYTVNHSHLGTMTGVTYNGVSMTLIASNNASNNKGQCLWYLINPATGTNNIVASKNDSSGWIDSYSSSYTGVSQTGQPDAYVVPSEETTTSYARSITTVADNCWITWGMCAGSGAALTAGSNTTIVQQAGWGGAHSVAGAAAHSDQTPAGSKTLTVTSSSQIFNSIMASFSPATVTSAVKTINGLAIASVKTVNGLSTASVKTVNGLA